MKKDERKEHGFTLVELMVVIAILGLITGVVVVNVLGKAKQAKWNIAKTQAKKFAEYIEFFEVDCGRPPTADEGLDALLNKPNDPRIARKWSGPYIKKTDKIPKDPWGNEYVYKIPGSNNQPYEVISWGEDGEEGGEKYDEDIYSWKSYED